MSVERTQGTNRKRVIVEIGTGSRPFPAVGQREIRDNEIYIGSDKCFDDISLEYSTKRLQKRKGTHTGSIHLIRADGRKLPLRNESADEVVFCNVFGSAGAEKALPELIKETERVLRKDGIATIVETITPDFTPWDRLPYLMMWHGGLQRRNQMHGKDNADFISGYESSLLSGREQSPNAYIARFQKPRWFGWIPGKIRCLVGF